MRLFPNYFGIPAAIIAGPSVCQDPTRASYVVSMHTVPSHRAHRWTSSVVVSTGSQATDDCVTVRSDGSVHRPWGLFYSRTPCNTGGA